VVKQFVPIVPKFISIIHIFVRSEFAV